MDYSSKTFFANQNMPKNSPFRCAWWFRTEFTAPPEMAQKISWLDFLGINYRANVWLNGKKIADAKDVAGKVVTFEFFVSETFGPGESKAFGAGKSGPGKKKTRDSW